MNDVVHDRAKAMAGMCECADCEAARTAGPGEHAVQRYRRLEGALAEKRLDEEIAKEPRIRRMRTLVAAASVVLVAVLLAAGVLASGG